MTNAPILTDTEQQIETIVREIAMNARQASRVLGLIDTVHRNNALLAGAQIIRESQKAILEANQMDLAFSRELDLSTSMMDRLILNEDRIQKMASGLEMIAALPNPLGKILDESVRPNGLKISRVSVPLGVIGIIYESRPNVTADAGALCLKSGNAAILRGGSESHNSSNAITECLQEGLKRANLPSGAIQTIPTRDRAAVQVMLGLTEFIDFIVPRGGRSLIERVMIDARIPVIAHLDGNCHIYIHSSAEEEMAREIILNAL